MKGGVDVVNVNTSIPVQFEVLQDEDIRFQKIRIWIAHTQKNANGSYFSKEALETLKNSLANVPILGYIQVDERNELDYKGHEQELSITNDGIKFRYQGRAYGLVPENHNARFETKVCSDGIEREFLTCEALMWRKFPEAIEIIERDGAKGQSMELQRDSIKGRMGNDGLFHFESALVEGLCLLGDDYTPAMKGALVEFFSVSNVKQQMQEMIAELQLYTQGGNDVNENIVVVEEETAEEVVEEVTEEVIDDTTVIEESATEEFEEEAVEDVKADDLEQENADEEEQEEFSQKELDLIAELESLRSNYATLEDEVKQLREYKEQKVAQEHKEAVEAMFTRFSNELNDEDVADIKDKALDMTIEELETALYVLVGKKKATFTAPETKPKNKITLSLPDDDNPGGKSWGKLVQTTVGKK